MPLHTCLKYLFCGVYQCYETCQVGNKYLITKNVSDEQTRVFRSAAEQISYVLFDIPVPKAIRSSLTNPSLYKVEL